MKETLKRQYCFNLDTCIRILLLLGFALFYLYTIYTGSVKQYVHPRIIPFIIIASAIMILIAIALMQNLIQTHHPKKASWSLLFYLIPLMMAILIPVQTFYSSAPSTGDLNLSSGKTITLNEDKPIQQTTQEEISSIDPLEEVNTLEEITPEVILTHEKTQTQNDIIVFDSDHYYTNLVEIYENLDHYVGMTIEIVGFVYKDNEVFSDNEFVPSRLMMVCCAADMAPVGLLCRYEKTNELQTDSWVKVTGTLDKTEFQDNIIPVINVLEVQATTPPEVEYIYPY